MIYNICNIGEELEEEEKPLPPSPNYSYAIGGRINDKIITWENNIGRINTANISNQEEEKSDIANIINQIDLVRAQNNRNMFLINMLKAANYNMRDCCFQMQGTEIPRESVMNYYNEIFKK